MVLCFRRTLVQNSLTELISVLDRYEHVDWVVDVQEVVYHNVTYIKIESRPRSPPSNDSNFYYMRIYVRLKNFKVTAVRPSKRRNGQDDDDPAIFGIDSPNGRYDELVVWRTKAKGILYAGKTTIVEVHKPGRARYLGQ